MKKDRVAGRAFHITCGLDVHDPFGQGAGLVGADHIHAAEVLDRREPFDDDSFCGHPFGAMREVDADDRGEKLRG